MNKTTTEGVIEIFAAMGETFAERNAEYKDNALNVAKAMTAFYPDGVTLKTEADHYKFHLFTLIVVKLTRFVNSGMTHIDSIHDPAVYAAMIENYLRNEK